VNSTFSSSIRLYVAGRAVVAFGHLRATLVADLRRVSPSGFLVSGGRGVRRPGIGGYGTGLLLRSVDGGGLGHN